MFLILSLLISTSGFAAPSLETLSSTPKWHKLLHYKKNLFGGVESQADGAGFFLHPEGKTSPLEELKANVEAFSKTSNPTDEDAACKFPARLKWLNRELGGPWRVDLSGCRRYVEFFSKLAAKRASIIFSSYYLSNPNSAFGHTLLRLSRYEDKDETEMLDYGVNYAADTSVSNPFTYAWKGLFGGFKGEFRALPYYYKVREYNSFEFRDIWSYELKLSMPEVLEMVDHIWELGHTDFDYFYFLENCAYHLLSVIDVVRPELNLTDKYSVFAIPADTVRLLQEEGLIDEGRRRESTYSRLMRLSEGLPASSVRKVQAIARNPLLASKEVEGMEVKSAADLLDVAMEAFDYYNAEKILTDDPKTKEAKSHILKARAVNPVISGDDKVKTDLSDSPALTHGPTRLTFASAYDHGQGREAIFQWRAALHDLLDPRPGALRAAELEIGKATVKYKEKDYSSGALILEDVTVMNLKNYPTQSAWASPISWELEVGMRQRGIDTCFDCPESLLLGSVGNSLELLSGRVLMAFLLNSELNFQNSYERGYRLGFGPKLVTRFIFSDAWMLGFTPLYHFEAYGPDHRLEGELELRHHLNRDLSLVLQGKTLQRDEAWERSGLLGLQYFL